MFQRGAVVGLLLHKLSLHCHKLYLLLESAWDGEWGILLVPIEPKVKEERWINKIPFPSTVSLNVLNYIFLFIL